MSNRIDTAQICLNGHIITDSIQIDPKPEFKFCANCGAELITECKHCNARIKGREIIPDLMGSRIIHLHNVKPYCYNCGSPYPWLESKLETAKELAQEIDEISDDEKEIITKSIDDLVRDSPKTEVSALRFKKIVSKIGKPIADALKDILVDVVSETAKKTLWPE
jgi:hypothetical protein